MSRRTTAEYLMVDTKTLDSLINLDNEELGDKIYDLSYNDRFESVDIGEIWNALHCLLTGVLGTDKTIEGNKLSEAIVGIHECDFDYDNDDHDFISYIRNEELSEIIKALESFNFETIKQELIPRRFQETEIQSSLRKIQDQYIIEMQEAVEDLLEFYKEALKMNYHVMISFT